MAYVGCVGVRVLKSALIGNPTYLPVPLRYWVSWVQDGSFSGSGVDACTCGCA